MLGRTVLKTYQLATLVFHSGDKDLAFISPTSRRALTKRHISSSSFEERIFTSDDLDVYHKRGTVDSTQDAVKRLLECNKEKNALALIADNQMKGRGTGGRTWYGTDGNLYLTCGISQNTSPMSKLTLLPIGIGVLVAEELAKYSQVQPVVKWPNDVLIDKCKVAGTLIENHCFEGKCWWLVGIGINIESHPHNLPSERKDFRQSPRMATCLRNYAKNDIAIPNAVEFGLTLSRQMEILCSRMRLDNSYSSCITKKWISLSDVGSVYEIRETGEIVTTVTLEEDGQLRVVGENGKERLLCVDYLY